MDHHSRQMRMDLVRGTAHEFVSVLAFRRMERYRDLRAVPLA